MRIVFMGTPDFAAASLEALLDASYPVVGVFTQPDRPSGRGMALGVSPVKALATARGIPVFQPSMLRDGTALAALEALRPDLVAVVAYGRILPEDLLAVPPLGCINVHGSLLPAYRGSAPIQWAVLNGEHTTGVSTMYLSREMDAGDVVFQDETQIGEFETSGELFDRLKALGAALLVRTVRAIEAGTAPRQPQDPSRASYTRPLDKTMCPIDWTRSPREIVKHICGLQPWPVATMELEGKPFRVFAAEYTDTHTDRAPGTLISAGNAGIEIACGQGETLRITALQAPGKKRMGAGDYLRGHPLHIV
ncbi:MAG: methionyl-tRNA formyltransferase [Oscillospiraceae bacterium]|nr:methionyl-tRNA formyltransferase [Oscillospiraceae bacterium]